MLVFSLLVVGCDDTIFPPPNGHGTLPTGEGWCAARALFAGQCVACHSAGAAIGGLDLETDPHAAVVGVESAGFPGAVLVAPGDPEGSLLYRKLAGTQAADEGGVMPPGGGVDAATLEKVREWITDGADDVCTDTTEPPPGGYHPEGWAEPGVHGLATKLQTEVDCRTCHGEDLGGGTVGIACDSCHAPDWETTCTFCHGGVETPDGAPPEDIDDVDDPASISFPGHTAHVTETIHLAWDCTTCHVKPTDALTPGHLFDDDTAGVAEVDLAGGLSAGGSYAAGTCSDVYCHGNGRQPGSAQAEGAPLACDGCHPDRTSSEARLETMSGEHKDHVDEGFTCAECHSQVVDATQQVVAPALHVNGAVDVALANPQMSFDGGQCTGACHGEIHPGRTW